MLSNRQAAYDNAGAGEELAQASSGVRRQRAFKEVLWVEAGVVVDIVRCRDWGQRRLRGRVASRVAAVGLGDDRRCDRECTVVVAVRGSLRLFS